MCQRYGYLPLYPKFTKSEHISIIFTSKSPQNRFLKKYICKFENFIKIFYLHLLPKTYIPSLQVTLDTITSAIWALNSQYFVFGSQNCVRAKQTRFGGMFCARTGLDAKSGIMVVQPPYCIGRLVFYYIIVGHTNRWCAITRKMMLSRFLAPWINATIWHWSWRRRKSARHRFILAQTPTHDMSAYATICY